MSAHYLYRCFDAEGVLLYIGCSATPKKRIAAHRRGNAKHTASRWLQVCMDHFEISEPYPTLAAGFVAEARAIAEEQPLFNFVQRQVPRWLVKAPIAEYLVANGHPALAEETACGCWEDTLAEGDYDTWCGVHGHLSSMAVSA